MKITLEATMEEFENILNAKRIMDEFGKSEITDETQAMNEDAVEIFKDLLFEMAYRSKDLRLQQ